jgi:hypothetical protein
LLPKFEHKNVYRPKTNLGGPSTHRQDEELLEGSDCQKGYMGSWRNSFSGFTTTVSALLGLFVIPRIQLEFSGCFMIQSSDKSTAKFSGISFEFVPDRKGRETKIGPTRTVRVRV